MNGHLVQGPRVHEVNRVRFPAPAMTDVDPRDGDVVKLVAVGVGPNGALMRRPKTLDLGIERNAVDDRKYAEPGCEHHGSCVAEQVELGQSSWSALRRRGPGPTRPRPDET